MKSADSAKDSLLPQQLSTRQIVHRLINRHGAEHAGSGSAARAAVAACEHLYRALSRWVGPDGCEALFARAFAQARTDHPALEQIQLGDGPNPHLDGVPASLKTHGDAATAEAIEAMLFALIELLARLIGYEMVTRLVEGGPPWSERDARSPIGETEKAR